MKSRLAILVISLMLGFTSTLSAQTKNQLYQLGLGIGLTDFRASTCHSFVLARNLDSALGAWHLMEISRQNAYEFIRDQINPVARVKPFLDMELLTSSQFDPKREIEKPPPAGSVDSFMAAIKNESMVIETARDAYSGTLGMYSKINNRAINLHDAYLLGVNIATAEGHSTLGDAERQIVSSALLSAKENAESLSLDLAPLNECILLSNGTTPMDALNKKIVSLRVAYLSLL